MKKTLATSIALLSCSLILAAFIGPKVSKIYTRSQINRANQKTIKTIHEEKSLQTIEKSIGILRNDTDKLVEIGAERSQSEEISSTYYLEVPFFCQAPLETAENWTLHEESCEEAAVLQAYTYLKKEDYSKQEANEIILDMIAWQEENYGGHYDLYADEMKDFISRYLEIDENRIIITRNAEIEDIKREIQRGYPVIVPITGEILKNPYYPYPGYHMLTVIGFTEERIITNDNGTRHGKDFSYDLDIFEEAFKDASGEIITIKIDKNSHSREL